MKRELNIYSWKKKKQRGQKQKLKSLCNHIDNFTAFQNTIDTFEHFHVPSSMFIEHPKTSSNVKTFFCKKWLDATLKIISQKPNELKFCKIVALISVPNYWNSQIIVFYDKSYYDTFWDRNDDYQQWTPFDKKHSFAKERNIKTSLLEQGYKETICDEDFNAENMLWFYGDVPANPTIK